MLLNTLQTGVSDVFSILNQIFMILRSEVLQYWCKVRHEANFPLVVLREDFNVALVLMHELV